MSVYAVKRQTRKGTRWYVRAEIPGRPMIHLGTFDTERRANKRIETAKDELAVGRIPERFVEAPAAGRTTREWGEAWIETRHKLAEVTRGPYRRMIRTWPADIADAEPARLSYRDVQDWIDAMIGRGLARGSIQRELGVLRMVLDRAEVNPNPARSKLLELPRRQPKTHRLPTRAQIAELHERLPTRIPLMTLLEWSGLRIHEAANLRWCDIDYKRDRMLIAKSKTTAGTRWVQRLPGDPPFPVMPPGTDPNSKVFAKPSPHSFTGVLRETHTRYGTVLISSHDWRHLAASRMLHDRTLSPAQVAARLGHSNAGITHGVYEHVVPPDD